MKIAIWHNLPSGGAKRSFYYEVRELLRRGHTIESWCPPTADQSFLSIGDLAPEHVVPLDWQDTRLTNPLGRLLSPYRNIVGKLAAMDEHCRRCAEQINRGGFDILFGNGCMFFRVTAISRFVDIPKTIYLGEPYRWLYEALPQLPWVAPPPLRQNWRTRGYLKARLIDELRVRGLRVQMREELRNAQAYDSILANSLYSRESLLKAYGISARLRYPGIDTDLFARRDLPREDYVVGVGAIAREKNIGLIVEALGAIEGPRPRLIWIGNVATPDHLEDLKRLAALRGVAFEPRLRVSDDELIDTLNRALAMVYAPRLEPFGLAPLEANACGLPVVAVAEGGVRETIVDGVNGLLVEHDPAAMARAIERLRDSPDFARQLGDSAERLVHERWSLPASIDRLERRFEEVLHARRG
jgi:glycosyltransferase involved in cell wall biosynthesis